MHVFAMEITPELIKPGGAVEAPGIDDQCVSLPMRYAFSGIGAVQILERRVLAPIEGNHAVHRLRGDQAALAGIDEDHIIRKLPDV